MSKDRTEDDDLPVAITRIGVIFLPTDITGPGELQTVVSRFSGLVAQSVNCHFPQGVDSLGKDTYEFALSHLPRTVDALRPVGAFNAIGVSCTSFSFAVGMDRIDRAIQCTHPTSVVTNMATSLFKAAHTMKLRRVLVLTPYADDLNLTLKGLLAEEGFEVVAFAGFGLDTDLAIYKVPQSRIREGIMQLKARVADGDCVDGVIISCSALRVVTPGFIDELELAVGLPVVSSMQSFLWNMLRLAGEKRQIEGFGSLLAKH